jgi:hypothetical protein
MKDFWRMVEDGTVDGDVFGDFLENPRKYKTDKLTLVRAINILGADKVIQPSICAKWNLPVMILPIRYREQTLREAAESNKKGETDFRLVYFPGDMSLIHQREISGLDSRKPPYFSSDNDWWLAKEEEGCRKKEIAYWPKISSSPGYYLIDFKSRFADMNWQAQEAEISKLGGQHERAPEDVFLFAVQSIYMLNGKNVTSTWWHWGKTVDSDGYRVFVYLCDDGKAHVDSCHPDHSDGNLRVSVSRKFDF